MIQFMAKPSRNAPCPCDSGKKFKKCCALQPSNATPAPPAAPARFILVEDELDQLSNSVLDLIEEKRLDEALTACQRLLTEYPEVVDGLERSAMVHAARGDHALALDFYRRALAFVTDRVRAAEYEDDGYFRAQIEEQLHHIAAADTGRAQLNEKEHAP